MIKIVLTVFVSVLTFHASAQSFEEYFEHNTLRIDYILQVTKTINSLPWMSLRR